MIGSCQRMPECTVCQKQELSKQIAEEARRGNDYIDSLAAELLDRNQLQFFDQSAGVPNRLDAEKLKDERKHRSFIARRLDRPENRCHLFRRLRMFRQSIRDQLLASSYEILVGMTEASIEKKLRPVGNTSGVRM